MPSILLPVPMPGDHPATVAIPAPGIGPGHWAGAPSAALADDGTVWLAYRLRRPVGDGRGYAIGLARSTDGEHFEPVTQIAKDRFDTDSLERPALVRRPDGGWRIYLSLATPGTLHWHIVALDADDPEGLVDAPAVSVLDGGPDLAWKDPVVRVDDGGWTMWVCLHEVADETEADAMTTHVASSADGLSWHLRGPVLVPHDDGWDRRGTRVAAVVRVDGREVAYYDGRASFDENWEERTGVAVADASGRLVAVDGGPHAVSAEGSGSLRYVDAVPVEGGLRLFYEAATAAGAHELRTEYVPRP
jgi:hypothetical protein